MLKANPRIKPQLKSASDAGARFAVIVGSAEKEKGVVQVKDLAEEKQEEVALDALVDYLLPRLGRS